MKASWLRVGVVMSVLMFMASGARTPADSIGWTTLDDVERLYAPDPDTTSCKDLQNYCSRSCEESPYTGIGLCHQGRKGRASAISVECCCCTDGWKGRYYTGG